MLELRARFLVHAFFGLGVSLLALFLVGRFGVKFRMSLFWRQPRFIQGFGDLAAETFDRLRNGGGIWRLMTKNTPVNVLTFAYYGQNMISTPLRLILKRLDSNVKDRKDQIVPPKPALTRKKRFEFEPAVRTA